MSLDKRSLLKGYFKQTRKPTFNNFVQKKSKSIENASVLMDTESALSLQRNWVKAYNDTIQVERPGFKLKERPLKASQTFMRIFDIVQAKPASTQPLMSCKQLFKVKKCKDKRNSDNEQEDDQNQESDKRKDGEQEQETDQEKEDKEEQELDQEKEHEQKGSNDEELRQDIQNINDSDNASLNCIMKDKMRSLGVDDLEKLINSSCISLLNDGNRTVYSKIIPQQTYRSILEECFQFDKDTQGITVFIDHEKAKLKDKTSEEYNLLSMVDIAVKNFPGYKREDRLSEAAHLRIFQKILDSLLVKTGLISKDGETVCRSTKRMQIINEAEVVYGRRIDLLMAGEDNSEEDEFELCSIEFKKCGEIESILKYQQNKNFRINACILNDINLLVGNTSLSIPYLEFAGRNAYISQVFMFEGCFVAHKVGNFSIMKCLMELEQFRLSVISLYTWRQCIINNNNIVSLARMDQANRYAMADISDYIDASFIRSPQREAQPAKIFLSPSKGAKRTRGIFETNQ